MYDKNGVFVRTIGRQGQGPGEYVFPGQVYFDPDGNVCVRNGGIELNVYGKDGVFLKKTTFKTFVSAFIMGPNGSMCIILIRFIYFILLPWLLGKLSRWLIYQYFLQFEKFGAS